MDDNEESPEDTGVESFSLKGDQGDEPESNDNQRTSTPTKNITFSEEEMVIADGQLLNQGNALSPVLNYGAETTTPIHDQQSSSYDQTLLSLREHSTQENSGEESPSLYTSALSNVTVTSDSCSVVEGKSVEASALEASFEVTLHRDESLGKPSTQDSTWATAYGSFQDDSDLKDVTIKQELTSQSNLSSEFQDEVVDDSDYENNSVIKPGEAPQDLSESTCQDMASTEHWRNGVMENLDRTATSEEIKSPDLDLLNEICEEATNMTIKEALICSLNPGVRAGLREGRLSMNESEILALEQYCEQFIDNLISQLLAGQWSESMNIAAGKQNPLDSKAKVAKKLSKLDLETLKSNCDRFVHSIITESLHNFCFGFQNKDTKLPGDDKEFNAKQNALDQKSVQDLLPIFKQSEAIQDYIGFLAADVVKSALANLSTSIATKHGEKNEQMILNNNSTSHDKTSIQGISSSLKDKQDVQGTNTNNDMWKSYGNFTASEGIENDTNTDVVSIGSDDDFELQYARETEEFSEDEQIFSSSLTGALETSLEFDHDVGDWEGGGLLSELRSFDTVTEKKQKIVLRELSFDEHADVAGTELLAPVFLAIAEENDDDDEFQGMRKKAQSIENLCPVIEEHESPRQRSYSAPKKIRPIPQPVQIDFQPEEDSSENSETEHSEGEYEGDEESEIADEDEGEDNEQKIDEGEEGTDVKTHLEVRERGDSFRWHTVSVNGRDKILDLNLLEPYMKIISHGGYFSDTKATIVVIAACYLPNRSVKNYDFLMEQLFFYVISTLELLAIHEEYYLVYLNGGTRQQNMPSVTWMKRFYQYIEGGPKKRMREMFIVHPNFRLKAVITLAKPLLNANFWRKLSFVHTLSSLSSRVPVDYIYIPDEVMRVDPNYREVHNR